MNSIYELTPAQVNAAHQKAVLRMNCGEPSELAFLRAAANVLSELVDHESEQGQHIIRVLSRSAKLLDKKVRG
jgi:hypothetical protein